MTNRKKRFTRKVGFPPESLIYTGDKKIDPGVVRLTSYTDTNCESFTSEDIDKIFKELKPGQVNWINICSLSNISVIEKIGQYFDIHPLLLEDILNSEQFPKIEETKKHLFLTLKHLHFNISGQQIEASHISFIVFENSLITFSEEECDIFRIIRENILSGKGKLRQRGSDYLFYSLMDAIVDNYYLVLENLQDKVETLEDEIIENKSGNLIKSIHEHKKMLSSTRKSLYPLTETLNKLIIDESDYIGPTTFPYFKDVYDHVVQLTDIYETTREMLASLIDLNMSNMNNNMNNVIKTLTIVSTIFIPLTFLVGLYGMNFKNMPEMSWPYSYPVLLVFMVTTSVTMVFVMKRKKWF